MRPQYVWVLALFIAILFPLSAAAERVVLAPSGHIVLPGEASGAYVWRTDDKGGRGWLAYGWPKEDLGLEIELSSFSVVQPYRETVGLHYSVISEAISNNLAPAVAVGLRDMPNRGPEGRSVYLALSKTIPLTQLGERVFGRFCMHAGYGSGRMGGGYIGASIETPYRITVAGELLNRRLNLLARVRVINAADIEWYSIGGNGYAGLRFNVHR